MHGVSENIMLGQLAPVGTGSIDLVLNKDMLQNAMALTFDVDVGHENLTYLQDAGAMGGDMVSSPMATPMYGASPVYSPMVGTPIGDDMGMSPIAASPYAASPFSAPSPYAHSPGSAPYSPASPGGVYSPAHSPSYSPTSPSYRHAKRSYP